MLYGFKAFEGGNERGGAGCKAELIIGKQGTIACLYESLILSYVDCFAIYDMAAHPVIKVRIAVLHTRKVCFPLKIIGNEGTAINRMGLF